MSLMFLVEYTSEERYFPIRNPWMIAKNYFLNDYFGHLMALIPFNFFMKPLSDDQRNNQYQYICLLFLLKSFRMKRGF